MIRTTAIAAAVVFVSTAAFADVTRKVDTRFADFSNPEHVEIVYADIRDAAKSACRSAARQTATSVYGAARTMRVEDRAACVSEAVERTLRDVNVPALSAEHERFKAAQEPREIAFAG